MSNKNKKDAKLKCFCAIKHDIGRNALAAFNESTAFNQHVAKCNDYLQKWFNTKHNITLKIVPCNYERPTNPEVQYLRIIDEENNTKNCKHHLWTSAELTALRLRKNTNPRYYGFPLFLCDGTITSNIGWEGGNFQFIPEIYQDIFTTNKVMELLENAQNNDSSYGGLRDRAKQMRTELDKCDWWVTAAPHQNGDKLHLTICIFTKSQHHLYIQRLKNASSRVQGVKYEGKYYILLRILEDRITE